MRKRKRNFFEGEIGEEGEKEEEANTKEEQRRRRRRKRRSGRRTRKKEEQHEERREKTLRKNIPSATGASRGCKALPQLIRLQM